LKPAKVVAPYATILALSILPRQSMDNLARMRELGAEGEFGFYESLDYDHPDAGRLENFSLVKCFMAHHQGMSLVSINNFFNNNIMQYRFHKEPAIGAAEALLEEKNSNNLITLASRGYTINIDVSNLEEEIIESRVCSKTNLIQPLAHVLSNNHYMLMLTSDGAGFSTCDNVMINRWQPETIHEQKGSFIYIHNLNLHQFWSASYLPTQKIPDDYKAIFSHDKAEFIRRDGLIRTHTSITVSPLKNIEIRRIVMYNHGDHPVDIELTSYLEVVADDLRSDEMHPAFSKLFIETEYVADRNLLIANRRARSPEDKPRYIIHSILPETKLMRQVEYEIDRRNFIGRGGSLQNPAMIDRSMPMSNQAGFSRDTILSLRAVVVIPAGGKASVSFVTGFCSSKAETMALSYDLKKPYSASDIFKLALVSSKLELKYLKIDSRRLNAIQNLVSYLYYPDLSTRSLAKNTSQLVLGQHGLWRYGISGDYPIILLLAGHLKEIPIIQDVLLAYEYLRVNQVRADLVIINEEPHGYTQDLEQRLREMTGNLKIFSYDESKPSLFLLRKSHMQENEYNLLLAVSRLVLNGRNGLYGPELNQYPQSQKYTAAENQKAILLPAGSKLYKPADKNYYDNGLDNLEFFNGIGGFGDDGREYEIRLNDGQKTPMPWINVISNEKFGFLVSETGAGYTWSDNSRENKLTVWSNDPVLDPISEAVYIKDDISGGITSPSSLVPAQAGNYRIRHGFGYSIFDHYELNLNQQMTMFVPVNDSVKIWLLKIENHDESIRTLTVTFSIEWVLGVVRSQSAPFIRTDWHGDSELLTARNLYNDKYRYRPAYVFSSEPVVSFSSDRKIFYGTGGSARLPYGLMQQLDQSAGNGLDPCSVIQVKIILEPGQNREIVFGMGQAGTYEEAVKISKSYRRLDHTKNALADVKHKWAGILRTVTIKTPDRAMDIMANGWLQYQVISCRLQARAAFYQCGGAIGFRDQLQDVLSLMNVDSDIVRRQILICCSRQFVEGDVQHWWHKDSGLGVRTRITDDLLWLPYVTAEYVTQTGDSGILDEKVAFITGDALADDQAERMVQPQVSEQMGTVYQHCLLAIQKSDGIGTHGLPLMGGGDWNDGMNRVGIGGKGESVWLGWFLYTVIQRFIPLACNYNDIAACQRLTEQANDLQRNLDLHAWDGEWYLRAFFDNGTPLGSKVSDECRIDSISQSWSVLSEAGGQLRSLTALDSAKRYLVHEEDGLSLLLTPPFNKTPNDPGYIKGYYPGMRENGGQYTHAAIWLAMAHAKVGKSNDAYQLLTLLNPIHATSSISSVSKYEKEPYVMSADISTGGSYTGKAGWSWYTGSAGWMHQAIMQSFLGLNKNGDMLSVSPSVPISFKRYVIEYRYGTALYEITVLNEPVSADKLNCLYIDGQISEGNSFQLIDDGNVHNIEYHYTGSS
jgi:cellobiose phosphorylase